MLQEHVDMTVGHSTTLRDVYLSTSILNSLALLKKYS